MEKMCSAHAKKDKGNLRNRGDTSCYSVPAYYTTGKREGINWNQ